MDAQDAVPRSSRAPGLWILAAIVVFGMSIPIAYRVIAGNISSEFREAYANLPEEPEGKLSYWLEYYEPRIENLLDMAHYSQKAPWIVSHTMKPGADGTPAEVWGIDRSAITPEHVFQDGLTIWVLMPAPTLRAREELPPHVRHSVPTYDAGLEIDGEAILQSRFTSLLQAELGKGLGKDIPTASLRVACGTTIGEPADQPPPRYWAPAAPAEPGPGTDEPVE